MPYMLFHVRHISLHAITSKRLREKVRKKKNQKLLARKVDRKND